jgi:hypothetical protein
MFMDTQGLEGTIRAFGRSLNPAFAAHLLKWVVQTLTPLAKAEPELAAFVRKVESSRPRLKTAPADNAELEKRLQLVEGLVDEFDKLAQGKDGDLHFGMVQHLFVTAALVLAVKLRAKLESELDVSGSDTSVELPKPPGAAPSGSNEEGGDIDFLELVQQDGEPGKDKKKPSGSAAR